MSAPVTIISCENEPIHAPGWIQPFGCLLACTQEGHVAHASANSADFIGLNPDAVCGQPITLVCDQAVCPDFFVALRACSPSTPQQVLRCTLHPKAPKQVDVSMCVHAGFILIEMEASDTAALDLMDTHAKREAMQTALHDSLRKLHETRSVEALCDRVVQQVAALLGYDRVMVYRFDAAWNGTVVAQHKVPKLGSYLGQSFPASDIPAPARAIFSKTDSRIIVDIDASPVPLHPTLHPLTCAPLDIGNTQLRAPSPVHLEYLRHMEVQATMTLALLCEGQLWGLVACHHQTARWLPVQQRNAAEIVVKTASALLATRRSADTRLHREALAARLATLTQQLTAEDDFVAGLLDGAVTLRGLFAQEDVNAAVLMDGVWHRDGQVPNDAVLDTLVAWLECHVPNQEIFHSACLVGDGLLSKDAADVSGLLAIRLPKSDRAYVMWFKPEVVHAIDWAGRPEKFARQDTSDGPARFHPRASFALWQQTIHGHSVPFTASEIATAVALRKVLTELDLERQVKRERLAHAAVEAEKKRFALLVRAGEFLGASLHDETALQGLADYLVTQFCDWFVVYAPVEQRLTRTVMAHRRPQAMAAMAKLHTFGTPFAELGYGFAAPFAAREPLFLPYVPKPTDRHDADSYIHLVFHTLDTESCILIPLQARGQMLGVLEFVRDSNRPHFTQEDFALAMQLSERIAAALDNVALYKQALAANQSREYTLGVVSHDLRNPLGVVTLSTALLRRRLKKVDAELLQLKVEPSLSKIDMACRAMDRLIEDILSAAKIDAGHFQIVPKSFDGRTLLDNVLHAMEPLCEAASLSLCVACDAKQRVLWGDVDRLTQAFGNLIGNALKFTPAGGRITLGLTQINDEETFYVEDTGCGIPADKIPKVFDRFWQADSAAPGGAGLGLSIVRGIVEAHSGRVWLQSAPGQGTTFYFTCPTRPRRT